MRKATKLYTLLGVLLVVCIAAFAISRYEEKKEQIKNSGEVILEIPTESVTALSWTNESGTFSFTKDETWVYDEDNAFPVDEEKINDLLEQFTSLAAAFAIDDVEDYAQYGLDGRSVRSILPQTRKAIPSSSVTSAKWTSSGMFPSVTARHILSATTRWMNLMPSCGI